MICGYAILTTRSFENYLRYCEIIKGLFALLRDHLRIICVTARSCETFHEIISCIRCCLNLLCFNKLLVTIVFFSIYYPSKNLKSKKKLRPDTQHHCRGPLGRGNNAKTLAIQKCYERADGRTNRRTDRPTDKV